MEIRNTVHATIELAKHTLIYLMCLLLLTSCSDTTNPESQSGEVTTTQQLRPALNGGTATHVVHSGDFNGDGKADLFLQARSAGNPHVVTLGDGETTFGPPVQQWQDQYLDINWYAEETQVLVGDFNGDGKSDLLLRSKNNDGVLYLMADVEGKGTFAAISKTLPVDHLGLDWSADMSTFIVGDFDGDQRSDVLLQPNDDSGEIAIVTSAYDQSLLDPNYPDPLACVQCVLSRALQTMPADHLGFQWAKTHHNIVAGDFNNDQRTDLFLQARRIITTEQTPGGELLAVGQMPEGGHAILFAEADGRFTQPPGAWQNDQMGVHWNDCQSIFHVGDFNGDGIDDLLQQSRISGTQRILQAGAIGRFSVTQSWVNGELGADWSADSASLLTVDMQGDGYSDVLIYPNNSSTPADSVPGTLLLATTNTATAQLETAVPVTVEDGPQEPGKLAVGKLSGSFSVTPSGAATYTIPIQAPPGIAGVQPSIALAYSHQSPNGYVGVGWGIDGLSVITRCAQNYAIDGSFRGVQFDGNDRFCLDGQRLVVSNNQPYGSVGAEYRKEFDDFSTVKTKGKMVYSLKPGAAAPSIYLPELFSVTTKSNEKHTYQSAHQVVDDFGHMRTLSWALTSVRDVFGNEIHYEYESDSNNGEQHIKKITYTHSSEQTLTRSIVFEYDPNLRPDHIVSHVGPFKIRISKLLKAVKTYLGDELVREYKLGYDFTGSTNTAKSRLRSVTECGLKPPCLPPTKFEWSEIEKGLGVLVPLNIVDLDPFLEQSAPYQSDVLQDKANYQYAHAMDMNGDGYSDYIYAIEPEDLQGISIHSGGWYAKFGGKTGLGPVQQVGNGADTHKFGSAVPMDYNADGYMDLLIPNNSTWDVLLTEKYLDSNLNEMRFRFNRTNTNIDSTGYKDTKVLDFNGDGLPDAMVAVDQRVEIIMNSPNGFQAKIRLEDVNAGETSDNSLFRDSVVIDIDGDGKQELLLPGKFLGYDKTDGVFGIPFPTYDDTRQILSYSPDTAKQGGPIFTLTDVGGVNYSFNPDRNVSVSPTYVLDLNADSLQDLVYVAKPLNESRHIWVVQLNTGTGFFGKDGQEYINGGPAGEKHKYSQIIDYNGDGRADLLIPQLGNLDNILNGIPDAPHWRVMLTSSDGTSFTTIPANIRLEGYDKFPKVMDANGDGAADFFIVTNSPTRHWDLYINATTKGPSGPGSDNPYTKIPDVITGITDGFGANTKIYYRPLTDNAVYQTGAHAVFQYPTRTLTAPIHVVSQYQSTDGIGGYNTVNYFYEDLRVNARGRGILGFGKVTMTNQATGDKTITEYAQTHLTPDVLMPNIFPYRGMTLKKSLFVEVNGVLRVASEVENEFSFQLTGIRTYFPYVRLTTEKKYDPVNGDGHPISSTGQEMVMDSYGNVVYLLETAKDLRSGKVYSHTRKTNSTFGSSEEYKRFGRLTESTVTSTLVTSERTQSETRLSRFTYHDETLMLTTEVSEPEEDAYYVKKFYQYDSFGNKALEKIEDARNPDRAGKPEFEFDPRDNRYNHQLLSTAFPEIISTNALDHRQTDVIDARWGVPKEKIGPNQLSTSWEYDDFGRQNVEYRADGTTTRVFYNWCDIQPCPPHAVYFITTETTNTSPVTIYYDQLGREVRNETIGFDGRSVFVDMHYDAIGNKVSDTRPYFEGQTPTVNNYHFDDMNRLDYTKEPDGTETWQTFEGLSVTAIVKRVSSDGSSKELKIVKENNVLGKLSKVTEYNEVVKQSGGAYSAEKVVTFASYEYDVNQNLIYVKHPGYIEGDTPDGKRITTIRYDKLGRKIGMDDPDMGYGWIYNYDALGNMRSQTNANGQTTRLEYDKLNRPIKRIEKEGTTKWCYDTRCNGELQLNSIGKLVEEEQQKGLKRLHTYNAVGLPKDTVTTIDEDTYKVSNEYHLGQLTSMTYPAGGNSDGVKIAYDYTHHGYLEAVRNVSDNNRLLWEAEEINAENQITMETIGGKITTARIFDPNSGLIKSIDTFSGANQIQKLAYAFDSLGNLEKRSDEKSNASEYLTENFRYDHLNRLQSSTLMLGQNEIQQKHYAYDGSGNIQVKDGYTYGYGKPNGLGMHAVTAARGHTYSYDDNGNMINGAGRTIKWSSFDKPINISRDKNSAQFEYGPDRARYRQIYKQGLNATVTHYIGKIYEKVIKSDITEHKYYVKAGSRTIAVYSKKGNQNPKTVYLHQDHLGSTDVITDENGEPIEKHSFAAFGERRLSADWSDVAGDQWSGLQSETTTRGYTGHEQLDGLGLIHMNGRVYDPELGRFLSADPNVQSPEDIQSLNRYTYVKNNPLSFTDPTGYFFKKLNENFKRTWRKHKQEIISIALTALFATAGVPTLGEAMFQGFFTGVASTGDLRAGITSGITAGLFHKVGTILTKANAQIHERILAHGLVGAASNVAMGGKAEHGFISRALPAAFDMPFSLDPAQRAQQVIVAAMISGTVSELTGGKFANGAATASFKRLLVDFIYRARQGSSRYRARQGSSGPLVSGFDPEYNSDPFIGAKMDLAWDFSRPYSPFVFYGLGDSNKIEMGFFVLKGPYRHGLYNVKWIPILSRDELGMPSITELPGNAVGWFHTHPNLIGEGYLPQPSFEDIDSQLTFNAINADFTGVVRSHQGDFFLPNAANEVFAIPYLEGY